MAFAPKQPQRPHHPRGKPETDSYVFIIPSPSPDTQYSGQALNGYEHPGQAKQRKENRQLAKELVPKETKDDATKGLLLVVWAVELNPQKLSLTKK